jgi:hypothetical protein
MVEQPIRSAQTYLGEAACRTGTPHLVAPQVTLRIAMVFAITPNAPSGIDRDLCADDFSPAPR